MCANRVMQIDSDQLKECFFGLSNILYQGRTVTDRIAEMIDKCTPSDVSIFITVNNSYLYPRDFALFPVDNIRSLAKSNPGGIITSQVKDEIFQVNYMVTLVKIGYNKTGQELLFGFLKPTCQKAMSDEELLFCNKLGDFKRFYEDYCSKEKLTRFAETESLCRFVVDKQKVDVAWFSSEIESPEYCRRIYDKFLRDHPDWIEDENKKKRGGLVEIDNRTIMVNIDSCRVVDVEYLLVSMDIAIEKRERDEFEEIISKFRHKAYGKIGAIQAAASQLEMEEGNVVSRDDIELLRIIRRASESVAEDIEGLYNYGTLRVVPGDNIDLNDTISESIREGRKKYNKTGDRIELSLDKNASSIPGDRIKIKSLIDELVANAFSGRSGGRIKLTTRGESKRVALVISNNYDPEKDEMKNIRDEKFSEPFFSTDSSHSGIGLSIVRKIMNGHGGDLKINRTDKNRFEVELVFPTNIKEGIAND